MATGGDEERRRPCSCCCHARLVDRPSPHAADSDDGDYVWTCAACTFPNSAFLAVCEACDSPRPAGAPLRWQPPEGPPTAEVTEDLRPTAPPLPDVAEAAAGRDDRRPSPHELRRLRLARYSR
eukprot:SM000276S10305  [mRNA]  locus=s276:41320:41704:- [translate_table: standard]